MSQLRRHTKRDFTVVIHEKEYKELCSWVLKKPDIETGGDLFGLWSDKYTAVVQLVLGPGKGCRRTSVSFYQDVDYLKRVGSYLTEKEGLCHIGEWHSHHTLGLAKPSGGDENTVWSNMPSYHLQRFVIFIANITPSPDKESVAKVGCFLFELDDRNGSERPVLQGKFKILPKSSPFRSNEMVKKNISAGCESKNSPEELQKLYHKMGNELEMSPTVHRSFGNLKRKDKDEKQYTLSPYQKQMKAERGDAVVSKGNQAGTIGVQRKNPRSQGDRLKPTDTEELPERLQERKLDDNGDRAGAAKSLADEKSSIAHPVIHSHFASLEPGKCGDTDLKKRDEQRMEEYGEGKNTADARQTWTGQERKAQDRGIVETEVRQDPTKSGDKDDKNGDEQLTKGDGLSSMEEHGEDKKTGDSRQISRQDGKVQDGENTESEVRQDREKSEDKDYKNGDEQLTGGEGPSSMEEHGEDKNTAKQIGSQDGKVQGGGSAENEVRQEPGKSGNRDDKKRDEQLTRDEGSSSMEEHGEDKNTADAKQIRSQDGKGQDEAAKSGDKDNKERDKQLTRNEGPSSMKEHGEDNNTVNSRPFRSQDGKVQDGGGRESKNTKSTKVKIQGHAVSGRQTERRQKETSESVKPKEPPKKTSTSTLKIQGRSSTLQTSARKASGPKTATTKQVNPAKKEAPAAPRRGGQTAEVKTSTVQQKPKKSGARATPVTAQKATRQRQSSQVAQGKKTATSKKTNQPRPPAAEPDKLR